MCPVVGSMPEPGSELESRLLEAISGKSVLVLCLGSDLRGDDAAGLEVGKRFLSSRFRERIILGGTTPEIFARDVVEKRPDTLIIVDSVDAGLSPGSVLLAELPFGDVRLVSTHSLPLDLFVDLLKSELGELRVILIGIQAAKIDIGSELSPEVSKSVSYVVELLERVLQKTRFSNL